MMLKEWLLIIRILNILTAVFMIAFEVWFGVQLLNTKTGLATKISRMCMPVFVILLSVTIITAEFKYEKVVEHFKFLLTVPGLALFNLFLASLFAFEFSTLHNSVASLITSILFIVISLFFGVMHCLKPQGNEYLQAMDD